ncbi:MAG: hypothetical protein FJX31_01650 [Alphaproteobacteria bacterium]|nr:hypothetical protein [Alphaproteobacteria bacterium]
MTSATGNSSGGLTTGAMLAGAVGLLALPSALLAFTARFEPGESAAGQDSGAAVLDPAAQVAGYSRSFPASSLARGTLYPLTPASSPTRPDRSVTVAVRVDAATARALTVMAPRITREQGERPEARISPTAFSLGVSRGYANFAQGLARKDDPQSSVIVDPGRFSIANSLRDARFNPRIVLDETVPAGRAPRTFTGDGNDQVNFGGSYRLTRNIDVTAGVRYSQERERLIPPADGKQDNQAVYVGTQFRF